MESIRTANHTIAVDASNPFVPIGTKVVMNGVEYTVEDTGAFARYGVQFDVYYANHSDALHVSIRPGRHLSQMITKQGSDSDQYQYQKDSVCDVDKWWVDAVAKANLNAEQLIIYNALNTTYGNRNICDVNNISSGAGGDGMSYEIPPEALQDEEFARMIQAEKVFGCSVCVGRLFLIWFDCSGFVASYVINHCGNGWNYGRLTADGLRGVCTYVSPAEANREI